MTTVVYEYLVTNDWFGSLEKGTRLYYDYSKNGYTYHYEYENNTKESRYNRFESSSTDYFISLEKANNYIDRGELKPGPVLGELVQKDNE